MFTNNSCTVLTNKQLMGFDAQGWDANWEVEMSKSICPEVNSLGGKQSGGNCPGNVWFPKQDYKPLCAAVVISATLVNTQTTATAFDKLYY